jgi:hypothetical protein
MTHTKDEALQIALEALENGKRVRNAEGGTKHQPELEDKAITAIKQALAAPVQPVAWAMYQRGRLQSFWLDKGDAYDFEFTSEHEWKPLYTTSPAPQPAPVQEPVAFEVGLVEWVGNKLMATPKVTTTPPAAQPAPDYAWPTVADYEKDVGFEVNEAFKMAWAMARTTNALFT